MNFIEALSQFVLRVAPVDKKEIANLAAKACPRQYKKNACFVEEGEVCQSLLFIQKGLFRYYILHEGNDSTKDFAVDHLNPFCTAYTSFMTQTPSQIWVEALEDSTVMEWQSRDVLELFETHPQWLLFAKRISQQLYIRKEKREFSFLKNSPEERYQQFLKEFPQLHQRVPQYMIASYLGIKPESLSRIRKRLAFPSA